MAWIESHWERITPVSALLYPLSLIFGAGVAVRRALYRAGFFPSFQLPVPVVAIGNITVGGTGKTPLALWLAEYLRAHGRAPGIVCRGYGGSSQAPQRVLPGSDPAVCGDEAVLLARRTGVDVWAGADRAAAARALLAGQPGCNVVISDDGLQHYALARDLEICVVEAERGFGNGCLLPAGPLREPLSRLAGFDAVVLNDDSSGPLHPSIARIPVSASRCSMRLEGRQFRNLLDPGQIVGAGYFRGKRVHVIAGTGNPGRFFRHVQRLGIECAAHPFPDHHPFTAAELEFAGADAVVMTEKDAVKCRRFAAKTYWELPVDAVPDISLGEMVLRKLEWKR